MHGTEQHEPEQIYCRGIQTEAQYVPTFKAWYCAECGMRVKVVMTAAARGKLNSRAGIASLPQLRNATSWPTLPDP